MARVPEALAEVMEARQRDQGRTSLNDQLVADLAELYGVDLDSLALESQQIANGGEALPLAS